jgi:hypothetical protein
MIMLLLILRPEAITCSELAGIDVSGDLYRSWCKTMTGMGDVNTCYTSEYARKRPITT